jgi:hypothetical protein
MICTPKYIEVLEDIETGLVIVRAVDSLRAKELQPNKYRYVFGESTFRDVIKHGKKLLQDMNLPEPETDPTMMVV